MGFCKLCGSICSGDRCKCGGSVAAPVVRWNATSGSAKAEPEERYIKQSQATGDLGPSKPPSNRFKLASSIAAFESRHDTGKSKDASSPSSSPATRRFPRPQSLNNNTPSTPPRESPFLGNRISNHIASATNRPLSPLKNGHPANPDSPDPTIVLSDTGSFAKVYGSVLQDPSTLASFACAGCQMKFMPDATLYPSLENPKDFFCRACFEMHGGSRGPCEACGRDVLKLKAEGSFVENAGRVWHVRCFKCEGCDRDIGHRPMVDILGRPCCPECFDDCLKRGTPSPQRGTPKSKASLGVANNPRDNIGGLRASARVPGEENSSPVVEELARRIGAVSPSKSRDSSPAPGVLVPSRINSDALNKTISSRLAAISGDASPERQTLSPLSASSPGPLPALDFGSPARSTTTLSSDSSSGHQDRPSPVTPKPSLLPRRASDFDKLLTTPVPITPASGLLTPGSTPPQSPGASPLQSKLPSLKSDSPNVSEPDETPTRPQASGIAAQSPRIPFLPANSLGRRQPSTRPEGKPAPRIVTPSRIPSLSSRPLPTPPSNATAPRPSDSRPVLALHTDPRKDSSSNSRVGDYLPSVTNPPPMMPRKNQVCQRCSKPLFNIQGGGRIVSLPRSISDGTKDVETGEIESYHVDCFKCEACDGTFEEKDGVASFVRFEGGARHVECTPSKVVRTFVRKESAASSIPVSKATPPKPTPKARPTSMYHSTYSAPSKPITASASTSSVGSSDDRRSSVPRFGSIAACPGCRISVSPMEPGIVTGPEATKWHRPCLVCGGKNGPWKDRMGRNGRPGCGKKLDTGAKGSVGEGVVWCRDCWDQVRTAPSPGGALGNQGFIIPTPTGGSNPNSSPTRPVSAMAGSLSSRPLSRGSGALTPTRRQLQFPSTSDSVTEGEASDNFNDGEILRQYTGNRMTSVRRQNTGGGSGPDSVASRMTTPIKRQYTGSISAPLRRQVTGAGSDDLTAQPLTVQYTGNGVPITRQLTSRRPKSALGMSRSFGSQKSMDEGRGVFLARQMTGQLRSKDESDI